MLVPIRRQERQRPVPIGKGFLKLLIKAIAGSAGGPHASLIKMLGRGSMLRVVQSWRMVKILATGHGPRQRELHRARSDGIHPETNVVAANVSAVTRRGAA